METIKEKIHHLNELVLTGKALDAFEMYYHDDVIMQENEKAPTIGKKLTAQENTSSLPA